MISIVAVDEKWGIGKDNDLLFHIKEDMRFFREKTAGKVVVMGANTFLSLPNGALKGRVNLVLDNKNRDFAGAKTFVNPEELLAETNKYPKDDVFVIGGASVYALLLPYCDAAFVTKVFADGQAEVFYPVLDLMPEWEIFQQSEVIFAGGREIRFDLYKRKGKDSSVTLKGII